MNQLGREVNLHHLAAFQTLAMDLELKKKILNDLDRFVRREYYTRIGKAWKRGLHSNAELRRLLVDATNQSILVVEDADCTTKLQDRSILEHPRTSGNWRVICSWMGHNPLLGKLLERINFLGCGTSHFHLSRDQSHELFNRIESASTTSKVTPAEVAKQLMKCDKLEATLGDMVSFLTNHNRKENEKVIKKKVRGLN
ncbi:AAA-ATPase At3g50940-like [Eucalyptus grandis]|uniref:AAA-ATPase At3g50940-like n=1 Tax=Eucalyptus grandis TaxID=71139 RepID=UPI00192ED2BD|nr:AAA-ATPase At3g50940-like [Eucalyptus grandis]